MIRLTAADGLTGVLLGKAHPLLRPGGPGHAVCRHRFLPVQQGEHRLHQRVQPLAPGGGRPHHRHMEPPGESVQIHLHSVAGGLVHEVDAHHHVVRQLHDL